MRRRGQDALRAFLLDAAGRLLAEEGAGALTMRRVAAEVGCSTTVLYTLFGSKDGLAAGLYREGFERFRRRLEALPPGPDPLARLHAISAAYRESALAEPNYYRVMFLGAIPGYVPDEAALTAGAATLTYLIDAVRDCMAAGIYRPGDPVAVAEVLVAAAHGVISFELAGVFVPSRERYTTASRAVIDWFVSPGGAAGPDDHGGGGPP
jgi:AcrR family transcriptional regulator